MKPLRQHALSACSVGAAGLLALAILIVAFARHTDQSARAFDARGAHRPLTAIASRQYVIHTTRGWVGHSSASRVYRLTPHE